MSSYYTGDRPAEVLPVVPSGIDLAEYDAAEVSLLGPDLAPVPAPGLTAALEEGAIEVTWPSVDLFTEPGVYRLAVTVTANSGARRRLPLAPLVVQTDDGWHNLDSARENDWPDARDMADVTLHELLDTARRDVLAFAPALPADSGVPTAYRQAQLMHARNRWNAALADPSSGDIGAEGFALPARPLDWQVKQLLRPTQGVPTIV